jgi:Protein of unknown function (DUF2637)
VAGSAFPVLLDTGVFVASEYYLATVRTGRPQHGFRALTHTLVAVTTALNVSAAHDWRQALYHAVPPLLFAALVELKARKELGDVRAQRSPAERIPRRLWLTNPIQSAKLSLWVARTTSHSSVRAERERHLTAIRALRIAVPGRGSARTARSLIRRQLRTGTLDPAALITATGLDQDPGQSGPDAVLRVALLAALGTPTYQGMNASGTRAGASGNQAPSASRTASGMRIRTAPAAGQGASGGAFLLPSPRRIRTASQAAPDAALKADALDVERTSLEATGAPASMRQLQRELGIGQARATEIRDWIAAQRDQLADVENANGHERH